MDLKLSVIIPCWKEDLEKALSIVGKMHTYPNIEWIIAMAKPPKDWHKQMERVQVESLQVIVCEQAGRGSQMNEGARNAHGEYLLFHHCDTELEENHINALVSLSGSDVDAGAFHRVLDERHSWFKHFNPLVRWYNVHWGVLFGDQSIFVSRSFFEKLGGFKPYKLMEDVEFSQRLRKDGKIVLLDPPVKTSSRRSSQFGSWQVTILNLWFLFLFFLGVSPETLHTLYYKDWNIKNL